MTTSRPSTDLDRNTAGRELSDRNISVTLTLILQGLIVIGLALFIYRRDWENVFLTALVIGLTLLPVLARRHEIIIPPDIQLVSALFVFLSLFLGSAVDLYYKYWWWDMVLHGGSGFLFGMVGFLAATTQGPITAFIIVMEMVSGHAMVLSLMACALLASGVARLLTPPLYPALAALLPVAPVAPRESAPK